MRAKRHWLGAVLAVLFVLRLAPAVEAALPVGTPFEFRDVITFPILPDTIPPTLSSEADYLSYTHILDNGDFWGDTWSDLEGGELIEIYNSGMAVVGLTFSNPSGDFTLSASLDGIALGEMQYMDGGWISGWGVNLVEDALNILEINRDGEVRLSFSGNGSVTILSSTLAGEGMVTPEPASLLLLGSGLLALIGFGRKKRKEGV